MKNLSILAWWLLLLLALQLVALVLDGSHYLFWGMVGLHILKACYLGFACILFFRYLSFKSQRSYELMLESFNRIAGNPPGEEKRPKYYWVNPFLLLALVVLASIDFTLVFVWNLSIFRASIGLDLVIWLLSLRWVARTYWLKSQGKRERIKEFLDDSRSRLRSDRQVTPDINMKIRSPRPFIMLACLSILAAVLISGWRLERAARIFRVDDLKACMVKCMRLAADRFYHNGKLDSDLAGEACVQSKGDLIHFSLDLHDGGLYLRGSERDGNDYFGDGVMGDESLVLDPTGRFRKAWSSGSTE